MATMESIEFQIKGDASAATKSLDSLAESLGKLKNASGNGLGLSAIAQEVKELKDAASSVGDVKELVNSLKELGKVKISGNLAKSLESMAPALNSLEVGKLKDFASAMGDMSGVKISGASLKNLADGVESIGKAAQSLSPEALSNLDKFSQSVSKMSGVDFTGIGSAMKAAMGKKTNVPMGQELQDAISSADKFQLLQMRLSSLRLALSEAFGKGDLKGALAIKNQILQVESAITKLHQQAAKPIPLLNSQQDAIESGRKIDILRMKLTMLRDAMNSAFAKGDMKGALSAKLQILQVESAIKKLRSSAIKLGSALKTVKNALLTVGKKAGGALIAPFKAAANSVKKFTGGLKTVLSGLGRIAMYRAFRRVIRAITEALQEGTKNLYGWSQAFGGAVINGKNFAQTMDGLATSIKYLSNSLGAAAAPIISALAPAIDFVIDKIVALINVINQLFALLAGGGSWNKAIRKATDYEEAVGGAGGAAKKALEYLAPFDELNVLPDPKSGGGGGSAGADYDGMFEETTEFLDGLKDFASAIREAVEAGDWQGLGTLLGEKVNTLISDLDTAEFGEKVGSIINGFFSTKYWTIESINFTNIGKKIAEFLTGKEQADGTFKGGILGQINWEVMGASITQKITKIGDLILGAVGTIQWATIGSAIGDFLRGAISQLTDWLTDKDFEQIGEDLASGLKDFFEGLDTSETAEAIKKFLDAAWTAAKGLLTGFWKGIFDGSYTTSADITIKAKSAKFDDNKKTVTNDNLLKTLGLLAGGFALFTIANKSLVGTFALGGVLAFASAKFGDPDSKATLTATRIADAINALGGAALGFKLTGTVQGALLGAVAGLMVSLVIQEIAMPEEERKKLLGSPTSEFSDVRAYITGEISTVEMSSSPTWGKGLGVTNQGNPKLDLLGVLVKIIDSLTKEQKTIETKAKFTKKKNALTTDQTTFDSKAKFLNIQDDITAEDKTFDTTAKFTDLVDGLTAGKRKLTTTAKFTDSVDKLADDKKKFSTVANFTSKNTDKLKDASGNIVIKTKAEITGYTKVPALQVKVTPTYDVPASIRYDVGNAEGSYNVGSDEEMVYRAIRRALDETDFSHEVDGQVLFNVLVNRNRQNTRVTGVNALA